MKKTKKQKHAAPRSESPARSPSALLDRTMARLRLWLREPELYDVLGILAVALFVRFYNFHNLGLTHFDEGVYASLGSFVAYKPAIFYKVCLIEYRYAPPGLPFLIGIFIKLFGLKDFVTILPSLVLGSLSVLPLYFLARAIDGRATAFWASLLLAITNYHIVYSRMALTDVPLVFFFLCGLLFGVLAFRQMRWWQFVALGLSTGIAWNIKYNGPLAFVFLVPYFAIVIVYEDFVRPLGAEKKRIAEVFAAFFRRRLRFFAGLLAAALIALLCYVHWYASVDKAWGYEKLVEHHRGYGVPAQKALATMRSNPTLFFNYFTHWAPLAFYLAPFGIALSFWRWRKEKILVFLWALIYYGALYSYLRYTRLALPLVPAFCILAAIAIERGIRSLVLLLPRLATYANLMRITLAAALVVVSFVGEYPVITLDTNSYREAAVTVARSMPQNALVFDDTLRNFRFYFPNSISLLPDPQRTALLKTAVPKFFVFDVHKTWHPETSQFIKANAQDLMLVAKIPNRRYEQVLFEPASMPNLDEVKKHPEKFDDLLNIYIYRMDKPARIPAEWK